MSAGDGGRACLRQPRGFAPVNRPALPFPRSPKSLSAFHRPYSVPVTTTVVTPGVTVTAPVVLSWLKAAAGTLKA